MSDELCQTGSSVWDLVVDDINRINYPDSTRQDIKMLVVADFLLKAQGVKENTTDELKVDNTLKDPYEKALYMAAYLRNAIEEKNSKYIATSISTSVLSGLIDMYKAQLQIAFGLRYILKLEKENNVTISTPSND